MTNVQRLQRAQQGFSLIEIGIIVVLIGIMVVPMLRGGVGEVADQSSGITNTGITEQAKTMTNATVNMVERILAKDISGVETAITTVDGTPGSSTTTARAVYNLEGTNYYYEVEVMEMSHLLDSSGGLVDWYGNSVASGSAVHAIPLGNSMYELVLSIFEDNVTTTPLRVQSFYRQESTCGPADVYCPTYGGDPITYYKDMSNRYSLSL